MPNGTERQVPCSVGPSRNTPLLDIGITIINAIIRGLPHLNTVRIMTASKLEEPTILVLLQVGVVERMSRAVVGGEGV